ncbi:MAG TPA: pyruvate kinase, partial [Pseudomonas sp.]|nr:pyruvate kinase [Pseudomonas sp.]
VNQRLRKGYEVTCTARTQVHLLDMAKPGDTFVITAGMPFGRLGSTNTLRIEQIPMS